MIFSDREGIPSKVQTNIKKSHNSKEHHHNHHQHHEESDHFSESQ
jgi:hypothetical protein